MTLFGVSVSSTKWRNNSASSLSVSTSSECSASERLSFVAARALIGARCVNDRCYPIDQRPSTPALNLLLLRLLVLCWCYNGVADLWQNGHGMSVLVKLEKTKFILRLWIHPGSTILCIDQDFNETRPSSCASQ